MDNCWDLSRRQFLRRSAVTGASMLATRGAAAGTPLGPELKILQPMPGAVMHGRIGRPVPGGLEIEVSGIAPRAARVLVQGRPTIRESERYRGAAILKHRENTIGVTAESGDDRQTSHTRVLWDRHSRKRYRFVIDDNSFFLRDITRQGYRSLFECFYLKMLRTLHQKYGACFTLNIYYTTGDDWNLRQFPDKYRSEWQDNAHWLRLAFHAYANDPPRPYQDAPVKKLLADLELVDNEIRRFAGPDAHSPPVVIHWGMTRPEAWQALYQRGSRVLGGYFQKDGKGQWDINYRVDDVRSEWLSRHDLLQDFSSGIIFSKIDMVVNSTPLDKIVPTLKPMTDDPHRGEILDLLTHEQYFWPFYSHYLPDHAERMDQALEFVTQRGYQPVFLQDGFLGGPA